MRQLFLMISTVAVLVACGEVRDLRGPLPPQPDRSADGMIDPYVVRGAWQFTVATGEAQPALAMMNADANVAVNGSVAPAVRFNVDDAGFAVPADLEEGDISFGALQATRLRDNNLRTCGAGGDEKCTEAVVRIYTTGTPDAGFWQATDAYGAPITSNGNAVGLDAANAAIAASFTIPANKRVVRLRDFTGSRQTPLDMPISVNFDDAGAGDYTTTLVVEYAVR